MARGLGVALNIPIIGINSLAAIAANETVKNIPIVVAVDARAGEIYFASYDQSGHEVTAPAVVALAEAHKFMPSHSVRMLGTAADLLLNKMDGHHNLRSDAGDLPIAENFVRLARQHSRFRRAAGTALPARPGREAASHKDFLQHCWTSRGKTVG